MSRENLYGKIKKLKLRSFLVHEDLIVPVGRHLNVIVAPNGNGKSSIVAAIILGMGGEPKTVNDQKPLVHYIKNGASESAIEIQIYINDNEDIMTFKRELIKEGISCKSKYHINGRSTTGKAYCEEVSKFNIQINNLCQFIPQDRVQKFTQMNAHDLFLNTLKSVCSNELNKQYEFLSNAQPDYENCGKESQHLVKVLAAEVLKNEEIKPLFESFNKKNILTNQVEIAEIKMLWFIYEEQKHCLAEAEDDLNRALNTLKQKKNSMLPIKQKYNSYLKLKNAIDLEFSKNVEKQRIINEEMAKSSDAKQAKFNEHLYSLRNHKQTLLDNKETTKVINNALILRNAFKQDLNNISENINTEKYQEMSIEIAALGKKIENLSQERELIVRQIEIEYKPQLVACDRRMQSVHNIQEQRQMILRRKSEESFKAVMWLRSNRHLFQQNIYEPMLLQLNVKDNSNAKYLENIIAVRDLIAFTCENIDDMSLFRTKVRTELNLNVNVIHSEASDHLKYRSPDINRLRKYGFHSYVIDFVTGPIPILNILCKNYRIHEIPIGNDETFKFSDNVPNDIRHFFSTNHKFVIRMSRYTQEKSSMCSEIHSNNMLNVAIDVKFLNEQQELKKNLIRKTDLLKNNKNEIESKINEIEISRREKIDELREEDNQRNRIINLKRQIDRQNEKIKQLNDGLINTENEESKLKIFANDCIKKLLLLSKDDIARLQKLSIVSFQLKRIKRKQETLSIQFVEIETEMTHANEELKEAEKLISNIEKHHDHVQERCNKCLDEVLSKTGGKDPKNRSTFPYTKEFDQLPKTMQELDEHIKALQVKIDCMSNSADANLLKQYKERIIYIDKVRAEIKEKQLYLCNLKKDLDVMHDEWFSQVNTIVQDVNTHFRKFFSTIKCVGQVRLIYNNKNDYNSYGIEISVQFRPNTPIVPLKHFQSGGERTFSIALYTLSLQHLSQVPFRCVDEINQGMDQISERRVFSILVDEAAKKNTSQYFFVTPKLLPRLPYNDNVNYIIIFNSENIDANVFQ